MIREKIKETALKQGVSPWLISKATGKRYEAINNFFNGKNIGIENLEAVLVHLGLELVEKQNHSSLK